MLPSYSHYIFVHLRQKVRLRPKLSPKFSSTLGPNLVRTPPIKPDTTYKSAPGSINALSSVATKFNSGAYIGSFDSNFSVYLLSWWGKNIVGPVFKVIGLQVFGNFFEKLSF